MLPDTLMDMQPEECIAYAEIMAAVATCDGKFTPEEMSAYEARTASLLVRPFVRERLQGMVDETIDLDSYLKTLSSHGLKLVLRDSILMAACDGRYVDEELQIIGRIASAAGVDEGTLNQLYNWVLEGWAWHHRGHQMLGLEHAQISTQ